ncbi:MAG: MmcQ/YjbR family DNA-binding protein [Propionibacteriaceae bacterium]|nr:MmcQ/YjbR family DNA-binding protein [Propionibacteriaceae bacterium]
MAHPIMFDPADPWLAQVRGIALGLPGAAEKVSHGRPAFHTRKVFAYYGGSIRVDGAWVAHDQAILLLAADLAGQEALRARPNAWIPAYLGPSGWTGLDLGPETDRDELAELVEESFRATAPAALVRELERR